MQKSWKKTMEQLLQKRITNKWEMQECMWLYVIMWLYVDVCECMCMYVRVCGCMCMYVGVHLFFPFSQRNKLKITSFLSNGFCNKSTAYKRGGFLFYRERETTATFQIFQFSSISQIHLFCIFFLPILHMFFILIFAYCWLR